MTTTNTTERTIFGFVVPAPTQWDSPAFIFSANWQVQPQAAPSNRRGYWVTTQIRWSEHNQEWFPCAPTGEKVNGGTVRFGVDFDVIQRDKVTIAH